MKTGIKPKANLSNVNLEDIMNTNVATLEDDITILDAAKMMAEKNIGAIVVKDENTEIAGIFSERDIMTKVVANNKDPEKTLLREVMTANPKVLSPCTSVFEAFQLVEVEKFRHIPIVEETKLVGIVSARDINKVFHEHKELLSEMKTKFVLITSHELRTPTAIISGYLEMLKEDIADKLDEGNAKVLDAIERNAKRLQIVLDNIARLQQGDFSTIQKRNIFPISIDEIINNILSDINIFIEKRNQNLKVDIVGGLPKIPVQRNAIEQVILNTLLNAIRFTPDGGSIAIRATDQEDCVRIEIEDSGIGIPEEELTNIFESFYEATDTCTHASGYTEFRSCGLGVGLTIAKGIVEAHGGTIWAESEENKYARIIFTLPKAV